MNANQIINMIIRQIMRRVIGKGINAGMGAVGNRMTRGKTRPQSPRDAADNHANTK